MPRARKILQNVLLTFVVQLAETLYRISKMNFGQKNNTSSNYHKRYAYNFQHQLNFLLDYIKGRYLLCFIVKKNCLDEDKLDPFKLQIQTTQMI